MPQDDSKGPRQAVTGQTLPADRQVLDQDAGLRLAAGMREVWERSLQMLGDVLPSRLDELSRSLAQGELAAAAEYAHKLKGSAGYCGAVALERAAAGLETACREGEPVRSRELLTELESQAAELLRVATEAGLLSGPPAGMRRHPA